MRSRILAGHGVEGVDRDAQSGKSTSLSEGLTSLSEPPRDDA
ncbi:hypothetical protein [Serinibacter salmoneus]|nr:hypothetical protein [Serinibacter salmoneus]